MMALSYRESPGKLPESSYFHVDDIHFSSKGKCEFVARSLGESEVSTVFAELEKQGQATGSIRVYIEEVGTNNDILERLREHLHQFRGMEFSGKENHGIGFSAAASLWRPETNQNSWYLVDGIEFDSSNAFRSDDVWESFGKGQYARDVDRDSTWKS
ncbi:uncharacterized protein KD926_001380 [Aspergillus affinis]|uniref:uncharacterized protein n=1 Tax=Aspergillus affinis TaxID=1070780 RepID=UPI0022FE3356|nr:uncharacterized protein KD926_001380 [Aspergillus affinis]KAI9036746.1 hypothetical protein KD926_001380 [Aspergillus affinis]